MSVQKNTPNYLRHSGLSFTNVINQTMDRIKDPATLGIYCYLAGKPENWEINVVQLQNRFGKGREFIQQRMAELKKIGLIKTIPTRAPDGSILKWETILINFIPVQNTENPYSGEVCKNSPIHNTGFPDSGFPVYIQIKEDTQRKENTNKKNTLLTHTPIQETYTEPPTIAEVSKSSFFSVEEENELVRLKRKHMRMCRKPEEVFIEEAEEHIRKQEGDSRTRQQHINGLKSLITDGVFNMQKPYVEEKPVDPIVEQGGKCFDARYAEYKCPFETDIRLGLVPPSTKIMSKEEFRMHEAGQLIRKKG